MPPISRLCPMNKEKIKERLKAILTLDSHPAHIAAGFAVGVFISITPFFGIHTPMAIAAAFIFRLNKVTTITGAWVNTPFTVLPVLVASFKLGEYLLGNQPRAFNLTLEQLSWSAIRPFADAILLGSSVIGIVAAVVSYFACYWLVVRFRRKDKGLAELTRESVLTGDDLDNSMKSEDRTENR